MKNSKELCHPLCCPFTCSGIDTRSVSISGEPNVHYYAELFLLREGQLRFLLDGEEKVITPGEALLLCPGVKHVTLVDPENPARFDLLRMDPDRLPPLPAYAPSLKVILTEAAREHLPMVVSAEEAAEMGLPQLCDSCVQEAGRRLFGYDLSVASRLNLIFLALIRFWLARGLKLGARRVQADPIYSLSGYIQSHLRDGLRVEDLAVYCGLSYPWFAKRFREIYGISCKDYIEQIRVAQVEHYLLFTDLDLSAISEETGYADCSHMIKNFKRIMDITPGQYRLKRR